MREVTFVVLGGTFYPTFLGYKLTRMGRWVVGCSSWRNYLRALECPRRCSCRGWQSAKADHASQLCFPGVFGRYTSSWGSYFRLKLDSNIALDVESETNTSANAFGVITGHHPSFAADLSPARRSVPLVNKK